MNLYQEVALSFKKVGDPWFKGFLHDVIGPWVPTQWANVLALVFIGN